MSRATIAGVLLLALCLAVFSGVARNGFVVLDDEEYLTENALVARGLTAEGAVWAFTSFRGGNWHPLTWLSHMLDVELFGFDPRGHHLTSLALHAGSVLALFAALNAMTGALWQSALAAALFAVHPLRVESVAWAAERKDVLAMLLTMLALRCHVRRVRRPAGAGGLAVAGLFALALLAKPMPVPFPFLLLLLDWWPLGRWAPHPGGPPGAASAFIGVLPPGRLWREKAPLLLLAAAASAITLAAQAGRGSLASASRLPLAVRAATAVESCGAYLAATAWPRDLAVFYPHPFALPSWPSWGGALLFLASATALAWRCRRRFPALPVGWLWYLGALLPVIGLVQAGVQVRADRYTYLPHIGLFTAVVWGVAGAAAGRWPRRVAAAAGAAAVALFAAFTVGQVPLWRTSVGLLGSALERASRRAPPEPSRPAPGLAFIHNALGVALFESGRLDEAIGHYRAAVAANPSFPEALNNLGRALEDRGSDTEANALYARAIALSPRYADPRNNLGSLLLDRGEVPEALGLLGEAVALDPLNVESRANLGAALALAGRSEEAERELRAAVALDPGYEPARFNLGKFLLERGRPGEAEAELQESLRLQPGQAAANMLLAEALARTGRPAEAERARRRARALDPSLPALETGPPP